MTTSASQTRVGVVLSGPTMWALASATNEATIFGAADRSRVKAPTEDVSDAIADSLHNALGGTSETVAWSLRTDWIPAVAEVIPQVLAVLDEKELFIRSDRRPADFHAAQAELLTALRAAGYDA